MARLQRFFPKGHGKPHVDDRLVLGGIIFISRTGLRLCDAPSKDRPAEDALQPLDAAGACGCAPVLRVRLRKGLRAHRGRHGPGLRS
jgi:hypothetical protein